MNNWDYYVNASYLDTEGYVHEDQTRHSLRMKGGYNFSGNHRLGLNLGDTNNDYETARGKNQCALDDDRRADEFYESPGGNFITYNENEQKVFSYAMDYNLKSADFFLKALAAGTQFDESYYARYQTYYSPKSVYTEDRDQDRYKLDLSGGYHFGFGNTSSTRKSNRSTTPTASSTRPTRTSCSTARMTTNTIRDRGNISKAASP